MFDAGTLASIAQDLSRREFALLGRAASNGASAHVDESGNFSIETLSTALSNALSLQLDADPAKVATALKAPTSFDAYVLNLDHHWFAIRKIHGEFWDLNSLHKAPERISEFMLSAFLAQMQAQGYSIFVVSPSSALPPPPSVVGDDPSCYHRLSSLGSSSARPKPSTSAGDDDLEAAIAASLGHASAGADAELEAAIAASLGPASAGVEHDDAELEAALALSRETAFSTTAIEGLCAELQGSMVQLLHQRLSGKDESTSVRLDSSERRMVGRFHRQSPSVLVLVWSCLALLSERYPSLCSSPPSQLVPLEGGSENPEAERSRALKRCTDVLRLLGMSLQVGGVDLVRKCESQQSVEEAGLMVQQIKVTSG
jgi:hypothetical protein